MEVMSDAEREELSPLSRSKPAPSLMWQRGGRRSCLIRALTLSGALVVIGVVALLVVPALLGPVPGDQALDELYDVPRLARLVVDSTGNATSAADPAQAAAALQSLEVWALGPRVRLFNASRTAALAALLTQRERADLAALCGRCLWHSLGGYVVAHGVAGEHVYVATGDIDAQWVRDSAVQLAVYLPRMGRHGAVRRVVETAIRSQAYLILQDPYANAFGRQWRPIASASRSDRRRGIGGWVAERKYELDSGSYFLNLLSNYFHTPGLWAPETLFLSDSVIFEAVMCQLRVWRTEQHHETASPYRGVGLARAGLGAPTGYTGLSWSGFRPSDDEQVYGYSIPSNMYAEGALQRLLVLNNATWRSAELAALASQLAADVRAGIARHGIVTTPDGVRVYAYEVDGLGGALLDFDDPNLPSLLAMPLLGYSGYDAQVYEATRQRILSPQFNTYVYTGASFAGLGSPHTPPGYIWPLAHMVGALTASDASAQARVLRELLLMQCGNGLMHESVDVARPTRCTRPVFEWANAMLVVLVEQLLGVDCEVPAQEALMRDQLRREYKRLRWGGALRQSVLEYHRIEARIQHQP